MKSACMRKAASVLMALLLLFGLFASSYGTVLSSDAPYVLLDGVPVDSVLLEEGAKLRLEAVASEQADAYCWQIAVPDTDRWVNIADGCSRYLWVTHALVGSMLAADGTARLRCNIRKGDQEVATAPVTVTLTLNVPESLVSPIDDTKAAAPVIRAGRSLRAAAPNPATYTIVINYLFDDNSMAFEPYGASVAAGSNFTATVVSPTIVGYEPFRRVGEAYVDATNVVIDIQNITSNITINVVYEPALVNYTVHHHLQNLYDDEYSVSYDLITTGKALTGSTVGDGLALTEAELPGFKPLAYEKLVVAADGSTVIEIRYDRNYYLVDFDMVGGYGTEPVYTRYGATVGANDPIRHGYLFDGWDLVSYGGQVPTAAQQSAYALQGRTVTVPAAGLRYKARWITQETTYTMVFWRENADDTGYSYWGYLDNLPAMSGAYVSGQDYISRVAGIDDEQYFTFNAGKTEKDVLVEGDGSTVVNVYYTRNYYKLTFRATGKCTIEVGHKHGDSCYEIICGQGHTHTDDCVPELACNTPAHSAHTDACLICGKVVHVHGGVGCSCNKQEHTHTLGCWDNIGSQSSINNAPSNPQDGQIYRSGRYYIYLLGKWYRYTGYGVSSGDIVDPSCRLENHTHGTDCACNLEPHEHSDRCYRDTLHTHTDACYRYSCGLQNHEHTAVCRRLLCGITENHSHGYACNSSTSTNTVKTVYAKYGASIKHIWPLKDDNNKEYNSGERWQPSNSSYYSAVLVYIEQMPPDDFTLTLNTANYKTYTMNYYLQVLPGDSYDVSNNGKYYKLDNTIKANYNYVTKAEDFFDITGFVQKNSSPAFNSSGQITTNGSSLTVSFYYDRVVDHYLEFNNNGTVLSDKEVYGIMYGAPLKAYNFTPSYPTNLEPNAYTFGGWYTSPGCFAGTEVNWDTITMPEGDLMLYAKWEPVRHEVRVFKDATLSEQLGQTQTVDHKAFAKAPDGDVTNGNYIFQGWFYKDIVNGEVVEKAFTFNGIPVRQDMDIYAKWSSHVPVNYKIYYKIKDTDIQIADPTSGSTIAGNNKTFDAKAGDQLYEHYQTGYYPLTNSHTITMSVDGDHEFTFYYVFVESMAYKVQYINKLTGQRVAEDKLVENNTLSVVTETFQRVDKMMPDAYQKRLVLSADKVDEDNDGVYDDNVITFYYEADEEHAYYRVVHYIQNIHGDTYREYRSEEVTGIIGERYTVSAVNLTGFAYVAAKTKVNGVNVSVSGTTVTTELGADGALIELYYDRQVYGYTVRYVDSLTGADLIAPKTGSALFGAQIVEYAEDLTGIGYDRVSDAAKALTVSANADYNIIEFLYQEKMVTLKYQIIGPSGCGALSQSSENILAISGLTNGSVPSVNTGFVFLGWFVDAGCTVPVDPSWVDASSGRLVPQKSGRVWSASTYYAKFSALETELTIASGGAYAIDGEQAFLFRIQGKAGTETAGVDLVVSVVGNSSVTVTKLPTGSYTVTELTDWAWRYEDSAAQREITLEYSSDGTTLVFNNTREHVQWLDGNAVKDNQF